MNKTTKRASVIAASILATSTVGLAVAGNWTATGDGNGGSAATTAAAVAFGTTSPSAQLYPGGSGDILVNVTNNNAYAVTATIVAKTGGVATTVSNDTVCNNSSAVTYAIPGSTTIYVAPHSSALKTISNAASMGVNSDDACQGETFQFPVTVTQVATATS